MKLWEHHACTQCWSATHCCYPTSTGPQLLGLQLHKINMLSNMQTHNFGLACGQLQPLTWKFYPVYSQKSGVMSCSLPAPPGS